MSLGAAYSFDPDRALVMPAAVRTTPISGKGVFTLRIVASGAYIPSPIPRFVSLKVVEGSRPTFRQRSNVTVMRIEAVVYVAEKTVRSVKPRASANKHAADKPIRPVITVRSTVIRGIVEVPIRANGSRPDVYVDRNLGLRHGQAT